MPILANVLALALIVADEPKPTPPPVTVTGHLNGTPTAVEPVDFPVAEDPKPSEVTQTTSPRLPKLSPPRHDHGNPEPDVDWNLTLREAIRIGLDNAETVRVISLGVNGIGLGNFDPTPPRDEAAPNPGLVIARLNADGSNWKFKADVMAHLRSIEQQYWALAHQDVVLRSWEGAVKLGEEILRRERAEPVEGGRGSDPARIAEAEQQLENYRLNLVSATSDLITTDRQLRNILGLPASDNRRIIPATPPIEARVEPDWEISVREMNESQPDIAQQVAVVRLHELKLLQARNQTLPLLGMNDLDQLIGLGERLDAVGPGLPDLIRQDAARRYPAGQDPSESRDPEFIAGRPRLMNTRQAQYQLLRQRAFLQQIVHQSTHSLARFFLEVDANYQQFRTATRLRLAAQERLEAQRAFYDEGRITIDRLLDAVTQQANAIAQESQYKTSYNASIAALEEAKGTLLAYDDITIAERPRKRKAYVQAKDQQVAPASLQLPPLPPEAELPPSPTPEAAPAAKPEAAPASYKLKARIGGVKILEIEVEVNPAPTPAPGR